MPKQPADYLKEARQAARNAGLFFTEKADGFNLYRKTEARVVYLGHRANASGLCTLVKRCAVAK